MEYMHRLIIIIIRLRQYVLDAVVVVVVVSDSKL